MVQPGVNCLHPILLKFRNESEVLDYSSVYDPDIVGYTVPCGHCTLCTKRRRLEWTLRLIMEAQYYSPDDIAWVTLTYNNENLPYCIDVTKPSHDFLSLPTLWPKHCPDFMKRLRRKLDYKVRFYAVGEYGSKYQRPHLHLIIFGLKRADWHYVKDCWKFGFSLTKSFFDETCGYAAGYVQKKLFGGDNYDGRIPPFMRCSLNPSIGEQYFLDNFDTICKQGFIKFNGVKCSIPRTFLRKAYEAGKVYKPSLDELQLIQNVKFAEFMEHIDSQDVTLTDYEKNFLELKMNEFKRMNVTRNNFDTDFGNVEVI